jgi:hypothetical protein
MRTTKNPAAAGFLPVPGWLLLPGVLFPGIQEEKDEEADDRADENNAEYHDVYRAHCFDGGVRRIHLSRCGKNGKGQQEKNDRGQNLLHISPYALVAMKSAGAVSITRGKGAKAAAIVPRPLSRMHR